jgi:uncharacterized membrane protein
MDLLGADQWEPGIEVETHLVAEETERSRAGAIALANALRAHAAQEVEIGLHAVILVRFLG